MSPKERFILSLLVLFGVFLIGSVGYVAIEQASLLDAVYMTVITLSTVGYGETVKLSPAGRLWTMGIITFGIGSVSMALTSLVALFVSGELRRMLGSRKMETTIHQLHQHTIVCGFGRMGGLAARELHRARKAVVVIENDPMRRNELVDAGLLYVIGDATDELVLRKAGVEHARALVAVLPGDADNVYVTLTARGLCSNLTIIARAEQPSTEAKLRRAGANHVMCPQLIGASQITRTLLHPHVVDFFEVAEKGVDLEMDEYIVGGHSCLCGRSLRELLLRPRVGAVVVAIKRAGGQAIYVPSPDVVLEAQDTLIIIGPAGTSKRLDTFGLEDIPAKNTEKS